MEEELEKQIKDYNLGLLDEAETEQFEAKMLADPALARAVHEHRTLWEMSELLAENQLRALIRSRLADLPSSAAPKRSISTKWLYVLLVLCIAGFFLYLSRPTTPKPSIPTLPAPESLPQDAPEEIRPRASGEPTQKTLPAKAAPEAAPQKNMDLRTLALASYSVPESLFHIQGSSTSQVLARATNSFFEKNYNQTVELLKNLPEAEREDALSLRAHALFATGDFAAAARDFTDLEKGGVYCREAQWFALLAHMAGQPKDKNSILSALNAMAADSIHPYQKEAVRLKELMRDK